MLQWRQPAINHNRRDNLERNILEALERLGIGYSFGGNSEKCLSGEST